MEPVTSIKTSSADSSHTRPGQDPDVEALRMRKRLLTATSDLRSQESAFSSARGSRRIEHRQGVRHRVLALVKVYESDCQCRAGLLYEVSADGMFVLSEMPPGINQCVDIEFALSPAWGMAITIKGIVVHSRHTGFGLMFREPDDPALALLGECLR